MLNKNQEQTQEAKDGSTAVQAGGNVTIINNGLSYTEAKEVALDVFKSNFLQLAGEAKEIARQRAEEITESFLQKLQKENPTGLPQAQDPDFQYNLFTAQRDYARCADKNLEDLLVDLLVDRTKHPKRDMVQIVLNESISVASKLTEEQLAVLAIVFYTKYCSTNSLTNFSQVGEVLDMFVEPFIEDLPINTTAFQHLEFTGCGSVQLMTMSLEELLYSRFQGFLVNGFEPKELSGCLLFLNPNQRIVITSENDPSKKRINAQNKNELEIIIRENRIQKEEANRIRLAFDKNKLSNEEIKEKFIKLRPYMEKLFKLWSSTNINKFVLTSVGIALGHANIKKSTGEFSDLGIWIK